MELLAIREEKQVWLQSLTQPYRLDAPFPGEFYVCILFANDHAITPEEQASLSKDLVVTGCRYALCSGDDGSIWDDSVDAAMGDDVFFLTTWHDDDTLEDVIHYGLINTMADEYDFRQILILFLGHDEELRAEVQTAIRYVWQV
jgi:hypothetical protein